MSEPIPTTLCRLCNLRPVRSVSLVFCSTCMGLEDDHGVPSYFTAMTAVGAPTPAPSTPPPAPIVFKTCRSCGEVKKSSRYSKNKKMLDGLSTRCKDCDSIYERSRKRAMSKKHRNTPHGKQALCMICERPLKPWDVNTCGDFRCAAKWGRLGGGVSGASKNGR